MQNVKDFDFQIKKNQEDITGLKEKIGTVSKDLDDLVSLYEIVSEQMNPFVGLSKVTKKRIDALENFTKEMEELKERTAELESFAERSGAKLKTLGEEKKTPAKTIDTGAILGETADEDSTTAEDTADSEELIPATTQQPTPEADMPTETSGTDTTIETTNEEVVDTGEHITSEEPPDTETQQPLRVPTVDTNVLGRLSNADLDKILERALISLSPEEKIDVIIDEFIESIESLKDLNKS